MVSKILLMTLNDVEYHNLNARMSCIIFCNIGKVKVIIDWTILFRVRI